MFAAATVRMPVSTVVFFSFSVAAIGGWMSARYRKVPTIDEQITHSVTLGLFGSGVTSMLQFLAVHYWQVDPDETIQWAIILTAGFVGLLGMAVIDEILERVRKTIRTIDGSSIGGWISAVIDALRKPKDSDRDNRR